MRKIIFAVTTIVTGLGGFSAVGDDQPLMNKSANPSDWTQNYVGKLGVGLTVGEPTGATLKYWLNNTLALDGAFGWSSHDHTDLYLHSDVLWHNFELISPSRGRLPVYLGVGGLARFRDEHRDNQFGIRIPVGLSYMFDRVPLDIFAEIAPAIDVAPYVRAELTGGIGIRFWF
jgi:hypothetical protein